MLAGVNRPYRVRWPVDRKYRHSSFAVGFRSGPEIQAGKLVDLTESEAT